MKVVAANKWASVSDLQLQIDNDQDVSVLTLDDVSIKLLPVSALENDGDEVKPTAPAKYLSDWDLNVQKVESSNTSVLLASTNGTDVTLNPISAGKATVTITLNSGYELTKEITVHAEERKAEKVTFDKEELNLSTTVSSDVVTVTVLDQYGDPLKGETIYAHPTKTGDAALLKATSGSTNEKGEVQLRIEAVEGASTGSDTVKISVESDASKPGLASLDVNYAKAGEVSSYDLRIAADSDSKDATIDVYDTEDKTLKLQFVGKDSNGVIAAIYNKNDVATEGKKYTVSTSNKSVASVSVGDSGNIIITAEGKGKATITVKEGNITRATFDVTVNDFTPEIGKIQLVENAKFTVAPETSYTLDNDIIKSLIKVGDFKLEYSGNTLQVLDNTTPIGTVELIALNDLVTVTNAKQFATNLVNADSKTGVIFRLKDSAGNVVNAVTLPFSVDAEAPEIKSAVANVVKADNSKASVQADLTEPGVVAFKLPEGSTTEKVTVTFSEAIQLPEGAKFQVSVGGQAKPVDFGTTALSEDGKTLTITLEGPVAKTVADNGVSTITLVDENGTEISVVEDLAGNKLTVPTIRVQSDAYNPAG